MRLLLLAMAVCLSLASVSPAATCGSAPRVVNRVAVVAPAAVAVPVFFDAGHGYSDGIQVYVAPLVAPVLVAPVIVEHPPHRAGLRGWVRAFAR